jgi:hypothetical protein
VRPWHFAQLPVEGKLAIGGEFCDLQGSACATSGPNGRARAVGRAIFLALSLNNRSRTGLTYAHHLPPCGGPGHKPGLAFWTVRVRAGAGTDPGDLGLRDQSRSRLYGKRGAQSWIALTFPATS